MPDPPRICDLLMQWEDARAAGQSVSVEELCAENPELATVIRSRIEKLEAMDLVLGPRSGPITPATLVGSEPRGPVPTPAAVPRGWQPPGYEILGELGRGGMGVVYKARQIALDRIVALKTIPVAALAGPSALARFDLEARAVARLRHPHIVQIYHAGTHAGSPYFALEYLEGESLSRRLDGKPLDVNQAVRVAEIVARATHYAHTRGVVHRDLKPSNMLLGRAERGPDLETIKITDFGLARILGDGLSGRLTRPGTTLGTPSYMAPEQAQGNVAAIGPATDVYGLGAVLYEMLCGRPPFHADSDWQTIHQVVTSPPVPVRLARPDCPAALEAICLRCLAKDPAARYPSAEALADDLERYSEGVPLSIPWNGGLSRRAWLAGTALATLAVVSSSAAVRAARRPGPIRVGVLQSQTEFMGESGQAVINATLAAIDEINRRGGVLGHEIESIVADGQSDELVFAREARRLLQDEDVRVLFACLTSTHRRAIEPLAWEFNRLLVYPGESEGLEQSPQVICLGPLPNQHVLPSVRWCGEALGRRRLFVVGSDTVYARAVSAILADAAPELGVEIVGESYVTAADVVGWTVESIQVIEEADPDAIVSLIQGKANLAFIHRLRAQRITSDRIPTLSFCFTEHDLRSVLKAMAGEYLCGHYFQGLKTAENAEFLARMEGNPRLGPNPVISDGMVAAYNGVHLWARAVSLGGPGVLEDLDALRRALLAVRLSGPCGPLVLDPVVQCDAKFARVAQVSADRRISILWSTPTAVKPVAYPATRSRGQWDDLVRGLQARWGGHWSSRGDPPTTRGPD
jgi:ABC-type branched-subunit amino acid transport system substrate-binding protein